MIKFFLLFFSCLLTYTDLFPQVLYNFVPNASFEENKNIPCHLIYKATNFHESMLKWFVPSRGTPDIWSMNIDPSCDNFALGNQTYTTFSTKKAPIFGGILPHSGNTMIGLATFTPKDNYREYVQVKLKKALEKGVKYHISCWLARAATTIFAANGLGIAFSKTAINTYNDKNISALKPQIYSQNIISNTNWQQISANFIATDSLEYLTIGNFFDNPHTKAIKISQSIDATWGYTAYSAYYFIDEIMLTPYDSLPKNEESENLYAGISGNDKLINLQAYDNLSLDSLGYNNSDNISDTLFSGEILFDTVNSKNIEDKINAIPSLKTNQIIEITQYLFEKNNDKLTESGHQIIQKIAILLQDSLNTSIQLYFHSSLNDNAKAIKLCNKRSKIIKKQLENLGIAANRIYTESFGNAILGNENNILLERTDILIVEN